MKTLFEQPLSHRADPDTSYLAAEKLAKSGGWVSQKRDVYKTVQADSGSTSAELAIFCHLNRYQIARRLPELERDGLIEKGPKRVCRVQGSLCVTWWLAGTKEQRHGNHKSEF